MVQTFFSWIWILVSAYLVGFGGLCVINGKRETMQRSLDVILMFGLCILTVYAQYFSLFSGVGLVATMLLCGAILLIAICLRKELLSMWQSVFSGKAANKRVLLIGGCIVGVLVLLVALLLTYEAGHYDTYLYHAQSIRWIEEYGVAPGIGNLHNRLAYNSSFFALQALFSFHFLGDISMYSVNGFVAVLMIGYAICSMKLFRQKGIYVSDFLRFGLIWFYLDLDNYSVISSPGTDLLAMGLVLYLLIKWLSYWEEGIRSVEVYAELCLLAVYAVSVKLSTAMVVLLVITPAVWLLRDKRWKDIVKYISCGLLIVTPWLIRNVIISGYLIYPYPELDLFSVDWKMPAYTLLFDRNEIKAWGWGLRDVYLFDTPVKEWFPVWFGSMGRELRALFCINILILPIMVIAGIRKGIRHKEWNDLQIVAVVVALLLLWMIGSPLPRYGFAYMLPLPFVAVGNVLKKFERQMMLQYIAKTVAMVLSAGIVFVWLDYGLESEGWKNHKRVYAKYAECECDENVWDNGVVIYTPPSGDWTGYDYFPATPYTRRLPLIELRGASLAEGMRMKDEYKEAYVSTYGDFAQENMFDKEE